MPRVYKRKEGGKHYKKHSRESLKAAIADVEKGITYRKAATKHKISFSVLYRHKKKQVKKQGGQNVLTDNEEMEIMQRLIQCADWGYPVESYDLRMIVKSFLDRSGRKESRFKDNAPGKEWAYSYLRRHKKQISERMCQNIKRARAKVSPEIVEQYFQYVENELKDVPASNIINYDETNLSDDPGKKKVITKRGCKYPERVMNNSKSCTSLMFAGTADGVVLPWYVVYKATNLYDTWTENGPKKCRYNRSKSGWFDMTCFEDWVRTVVLPYCSKLEGRKFLIGDNLSSHLSCEMVRLCMEHNISFIFLPPNSTHLTQPLDIAFFRPMKMKWKQILTDWKNKKGRKVNGLPKDIFPRLLSTLHKELEKNSSTNIKSGFKKAGLVPLNKNEVLKMIPKSKTNDQQDQTRAQITDVFVEYLKEMRYGDREETVRKRKKKCNVEPGKSVSVEDFEPSSIGESHNNQVDEGAAEAIEVRRIKTRPYKHNNNEALESENIDVNVDHQNESMSSDECENTEYESTDYSSNEESMSDNENINYETKEVVAEQSVACLTECFDDEALDPDLSGSGLNTDEVVNCDTGETLPIQAIEPGTWLVVNFPSNIIRQLSPKISTGKNFIGLVDKICPGGENFIGKFVRPKSSRDFNGFIYGFPDVPDEGTFAVEQIRKVLIPPERYGRGYFKFEVNSKELNG